PYAQRSRILVCALSFRQQLHNLALSRRQPVTTDCDGAGWSSTFEIPLQHHGRDLRSKVGLIPPQSFDGGNQIPRRVRLQQEATRPRIEHLTYDLVRSMQAETQHLGLSIA